ADRRGRGDQGPPRPADERSRKPERPREAHPDGTPARRRAEDAGGTEPGLRRQPRAHPPDRGPGVREAAGSAIAPRRRTPPASGRLALLLSHLRRGLGEALAFTLLFRAVLDRFVGCDIVGGPGAPISQRVGGAGGRVLRG